MTDLAARLVAQLTASHRTLAAVESFTGGQFASAITAVPGASLVFRGGIIPYQTPQKVRLLHLDEQKIALHGAVSEWCAQALVQQGKSLFQADYVVSFTGNAGPTPMEDQPVGRVYLGFHSPQLEQVMAFDLEGSREAIQAEAVQIALQVLVEWTQSS